MATAVIPGADRLNPQFAQMAKHYGADVAICPAHRPQRKGVVEAAIRFIGGRFWRTLRARTVGEAQQALDHFAAGTSDGRRRHGSTVGELGAAEPLRALPAFAFPAEILVERRVSRSALVAFDGNHYSVPPAHAGRTVTIRARVGEPLLAIISPAGTLVATHRRAPAGAGQTVRTGEHARLLERAVLGAFTTQTECRRKVNRPRGRCRVGRARQAARPRSRASAGDLARALRRLGRGRLLMTDTIYQQLREHLAYLRLPAVAEQLAPALEAADRDQPGYSAFLHRLLAVEVDALEQRRLQGRLRFSKLPTRKTIEQFDFSAQPALDRRLVEDLATLRFIEEHANVIAIGPPGVGKTMLATALGHRAVEAGYRSTTPPPPTSSPAQPRPPWKDAGRQRCASGTDRSY